MNARKGLPSTRPAPDPAVDDALPGADSPNQTDDTQAPGGLPPERSDGEEAPDNCTGLRRPAGGTPNVPRS